MVLFGEPAPLPEPEKAALDAAHEMLIKVDELNIGSFQSEGIKLEIGIGIHCGDAIVGFIGSHERHEFTAIGDTVNTAARLEGLSKSLGYPIICSESIALVLGHPEFLIPLGEQPIKGRAAISTFGWNPVSTA